MVRRVALVLGLALFIVFAPALLAPIALAVGEGWFIGGAAACFGFAAVDTALDPLRRLALRA